ERQSAGRGRRGRAWVSQAGNLYVTYLAPADRSAADLALVSFAAGLAISDCIDAELDAELGAELGAEFGAVRAKLKWPNGVVIDAAKVSGLMLDSGAAWYALGVGVNLIAAPEGLDQKTTSLQDHLLTRQAPAAADCLSVLQKRLAHWDRILLTEGFAP